MYSSVLLSYPGLHILSLQTLCCDAPACVHCNPFVGDNDEPLLNATYLTKVLECCGPATFGYEHDDNSELTSSAVYVAARTERLRLWRCGTYRRAYRANERWLTFWFHDLPSALVEMPRLQELLGSDGFQSQMQTFLTLELSCGVVDGLTAAQRALDAASATTHGRTFADQLAYRTAKQDYARTKSVQDCFNTLLTEFGVSTHIRPYYGLVLHTHTSIYTVHFTVFSRYSCPGVFSAPLVSHTTLYRVFVCYVFHLLLMFYS